ncbi:MAG TPA: RusA family crossover junction endodeoxyribonuclease [Polyangiaceae bacterium]|nr:RusA family crossover junction endodeoxyribonuclease [Polyangiaceae bacterium]
MRLCFVIPGPPVPKERPRVFMPKGAKFPIATTPPKTRAYERTVKLFAQAAVAHQPEWKAFVGAHPTGRHYRLHLHFVINADRGDLENFAKSVGDALNGVVYADDRQVHQALQSVVIDKREQPRAEVLVEICEPVTLPPWMHVALSQGWLPPATPGGG